MNDILTLVVGYPLAVGGMAALAWILGVICDALGVN
jgi:hypothetical protein